MRAALNAFCKNEGSAADRKKIADKFIEMYNSTNSKIQEKFAHQMPAISNWVDNYNQMQAQ